MARRKNFQTLTAKAGTVSRNVLTGELEAFIHSNAYRAGQYRAEGDIKMAAAAEYAMEQMIQLALGFDLSHMEIRQMVAESHRQGKAHGEWLVERRAAAAADPLGFDAFAAQFDTAAN